MPTNDSVELPGWKEAIKKATAAGRDPQDFEVVAQFVHKGTTDDDLRLGQAIEHTRNHLMRNAQVNDAINLALARHVAEAKQAVEQAVWDRDKREATHRDYHGDRSTSRLVYAMAQLNKGLLHKQASRFAPVGTPEHEDLVDVGMGISGSLSAKPDGLLYAALHYDPDRTVKFSTYATIAIKNALKSDWRKSAKHSVRASSLPDGLDQDLSATEPEDSTFDEQRAPRMLKAIAEALERVPDSRGRQILQRGFQAILAGERPPSLQTIADEWDLTKEGVRQIRHRAWEHFTKQLKQIDPQLATDGISKRHPQFHLMTNWSNAR